MAVRPSSGAWPRTPSRPWKALPSVLQKELGQADINWENAVCLERLGAVWKDLVGDLLARHASPGEIRGDALVVFVDNSAWLAELSRMHARALLERIGRTEGCGKVRKVDFRLHPDLKRRPPLR